MASSPGPLEVVVADLQKQLGKKSAFEQSVKRLTRIVQEDYARATEKEQSTVFAAVSRAATLLQTRYTTPGFWQAGLGLFQAADDVVKKPEQRKQVRAHMVMARGFTGEQQQQEGEGEAQGEDAPMQEGGHAGSVHTGGARDSAPQFLFEGQLSSGAPAARPAWLVQQQALFTFLGLSEQEAEAARTGDSAPARARAHGDRSAGARASATSGDAREGGGPGEDGNSEGGNGEGGNGEGGRLRRRGRPLAADGPSVERAEPAPAPPGGNAGSAGAATGAAAAGAAAAGADGREAEEGQQDRSGDAAMEDVSDDVAAGDGNRRQGTRGVSSSLEGGEQEQEEEEGGTAGSMRTALERLQGLQSLLDTWHNVANRGPGGDEEAFAGLQEALQATMEATPQGAPPASKREVARLPQVPVTEAVLARLGEGAACPVCCEGVRAGEVIQEMPCAHFFHPACLKPWLDTNNSCPTCRFELPTDDVEYERRKEREKEDREERSGVENALRGGEFTYL